MITSIAESCKIESQKISLLISELYKSQEIINEERDLLDAEIRKIRNDIIAVDNDINNILNRDINYISESIRKFNNHKEYLLQVKEKRSQLDFYLKLQNKISTTINFSTMVSSLLFNNKLQQLSCQNILKIF